MSSGESIAIVTGANSGIGYAVTELLIQAGFLVIGADLSNSSREDCKDEQYRFIMTNVALEADIQRLFAAIEQRWGRLDLLCNCAGITSLENFSSITSSDWDMMMNINLKAVFLTCQHALNLMKKRKSGKIVNVASNAGKEGGKRVGAHYAASKAGVITLTRSLALYAADLNINVNCVAPGPTRTPMTDSWDNAIQQSLIDKIPLHRFAEAQEIAEAILFLASPQADYITGETLNVNGGLIMD
jgi:3-oxoacyl-[acyl-carrier protein] reductase